MRVQQPGIRVQLLAEDLRRFLAGEPILSKPPGRLTRLRKWAVRHKHGVAAVAGLHVYEHTLVRPGDLRRLDAAFFTVNGVISVVFFAFVVLDTVVGRLR